MNYSFENRKTDFKKVLTSLKKQRHKIDEILNKSKFINS